jgi:ferredoxin/plasmid stabilization system protein ParE
MLIGAPLPPLRSDLEMHPFDDEGRPMFMLSDLIGLTTETVAVPAAALFVASLFDGQRTAEAVCGELAKNQVNIPAQEIQALAEDLLANGLLDTPESGVKRVKALEDFRRSTVRPFRADFRGLPEDPIEIGRFLNEFYKHPQGPGALPSGTPAQDAPLGLVAPHIDFFRGGPAYAWAYGELARSRPPDLVVAFGVAHLSPRSPWVLTKKSYGTPYGPMTVDETLYEEFQSALWYDPLDEEWAHAKEHSLEFQALWLKHTWMQETPKWLPVLTSSFEGFCGENAPSAIQSIEEGIGAAPCVTVAPGVFQLDEENKAYIVDQNGADADTILLAAQACPVQAIKVYDENGVQIYP